MKAAVCIGVVLLAVAWAPAALADNSTRQEAYGGPQQTQVVLGSQSGAKKAGKAPAGATLPFTGLDLGLLAVGGAALVVVGFGMRRAARDRNPQS